MFSVMDLSHGYLSHPDNTMGPCECTSQAPPDLQLWGHVWRHAAGAGDVVSCVYTSIYCRHILGWTYSPVYAQHIQHVTVCQILALLLIAFWKRKSTGLLLSNVKVKLCWLCVETAFSLKSVCLVV